LCSVHPTMGKAAEKDLRKRTVERRKTDSLSKSEQLTLFEKKKSFNWIGKASMDQKNAGKKRLEDQF